MAVAPRPLRADAERNRRRILDAARRVFAERGLDAGVDEVAHCAGVGVGTLYRHFVKKERLLMAVMEDRAADLLEQFAAAAELADPWDRFAAAAEAFAGTIATDRGLFQVLNEAEGAGPAFEAAKRRAYDALEPIVLEAQRAGVVRADVVVQDVPALCAVAARLPASRLREAPELWRRYLAVVLDGLRPGGRPLPHPPPERIGSAVPPPGVA